MAVTRNGGLRFGPPAQGLLVFAFVVLGVAGRWRRRAGLSGWDLRRAPGLLVVGRARVALAASTPSASRRIVEYTMSGGTEARTIPRRS